MARNLVFRIALDVIVWLVASTTLNARDLGQWDDPANADIKKWYQDLKQPDNLAVSCCGEADAYWADAFEATSEGEYVAIITDPRDDEPLGRRHRDIGTRIADAADPLYKMLDEGQKRRLAILTHMGGRVGGGWRHRGFDHGMMGGNRDRGYDRDDGPRRDPDSRGGPERL